MHERRDDELGRRARAPGHAYWLGMLVLLAGWLGGCELDDFLNNFDNGDPCSAASGPVDVAGTWRLTASGSRSSCNDDRFDGSFRLPVLELEVQQVEDPDDSSRDQLELSVVPTVPGGRFTFGGAVRGTCVDFTVEEDGTTGFFRFVFDGARESSDIVGDFTGQGPPGCDSSGEFRVVVE